MGSSVHVRMLIKIAMCFFGHASCAIGCLICFLNCGVREQILVSSERILFYRAVTFDKDITPYIHVFIYHAQYFAEKYGSLKAFEMEAVEQLNYVNKLVFFGASNHGKEHFSVTEQVWNKFGGIFMCVFQKHLTIGEYVNYFSDYVSFNKNCCCGHGGP